MKSPFDPFSPYVFTASMAVVFLLALIGAGGASSWQVHQNRLAHAPYKPPPPSLYDRLSHTRSRPRVQHQEQRNRVVPVQATQLAQLVIDQFIEPKDEESEEPDEVVAEPEPTLAELAYAELASGVIDTGEPEDYPVRSDLAGLPPFSDPYWLPICQSYPLEVITDEDCEAFLTDLRDVGARNQYINFVFAPGEED